MMTLLRVSKSRFSTSKEELDAKGKRGFDYAINHFSKQKNLLLLVKECVKVMNNQDNKK